VAFSPDSSQLITANADNVRTFDMNYVPRRKTEFFAPRLKQLHLAPDGASIAGVIDEDGHPAIRVIRLGRDKRDIPIAALANNARFEYSADGSKLVYVTDFDSRASVVDLDDFHQISSEAIMQPYFQPLATGRGDFVWISAIGCIQVLPSGGPGLALSPTPAVARQSLTGLKARL
jgi:hypothetical protein